MVSVWWDWNEIFSIRLPGAVAAPVMNVLCDLRTDTLATPSSRIYGGIPHELSGEDPVMVKMGGWDSSPLQFRSTPHGSLRSYLLSFRSCIPTTEQIGTGGLRESKAALLETEALCRIIYLTSKLSWK